MKQGLYKWALAVLIIVMTVSVAGCLQKEKDQTTNNDTIASVSETGTVLEDKDGNKVEDQAISEKLDEDVNEVIENDGKKMESLAPALELIDGGLKEIYTPYGINAGTCLSDVMIAASSYQNIITKNFNQITLENYLKPDYILSKAKSIASGELEVEITEKTTALLDWAKDNKMSIRGHVLIWYSQTPDWIFYENFDNSKSLVDRDTMLIRMENYIKQVFEQLDELGYTDLFYAYDVVNEALMEDGTYRDCLWKQVIGDDYIWYAFYYANQYAPERIDLYYNDYNEQFKKLPIIKLAQSLVDDTGKSLIDGIGCQGHLYTEDSIDNYMLTLKAFSELGLEVQITELDVSLGSWMNIKNATEGNLRIQGQYYYELINRIIEDNKEGTTKVSGITFWGFADHLSWRNDRSPLLYDSNLNPKYSYYGAMQIDVE